MEVVNSLYAKEYIPQRFSLDEVRANCMCTLTSDLEEELEVLRNTFYQLKEKLLPFKKIYPSSSLTRIQEVEENQWNSSCVNFLLDDQSLSGSLNNLDNSVCYINIISYFNIQKEGEIKPDGDFVNCYGRKVDFYYGENSFCEELFFILDEECADGPVIKSSRIELNVFSSNNLDGDMKMLVISLETGEITLGNDSMGYINVKLFNVLNEIVFRSINFVEEELKEGSFL